MPPNVAVFYGQFDKRAQGWYWTARPNAEKPVKAAIAGPFETKAEAVEDAVRNVQVSAERPEEGNAAIGRGKEAV